MAVVRHRKRRRRSSDPKDRLVQARIPERLEHVLKEEAEKRRLSVSHLIRNMLEDTFELVDSVVSGAGDIAKDGAAIAAQVKQDAGRFAAGVRGAAEGAEKLATTVREVVRTRREDTHGAASDAENTDDYDDDLDDDLDDSDEVEDAAPVLAPLAGLDHILAWNQVVANKEVTCAGCGRSVYRGDTAHLGISQNPGAAPTWLCPRCITRL